MWLGDALRYVRARVRVAASRKRKYPYQGLVNVNGTLYGTATAGGAYDAGPYSPYRH